MLPLIGAYQAANALVAAGLALVTGSEPGQVFDALGRLPENMAILSVGRSEVSQEAWHADIKGMLERMDKLEHLVAAHAGVRRALAMSAGREVRVVVEPSEVDDYALPQLAVDVEQCELGALDESEGESLVGDALSLGDSDAASVGSTTLPAETR